VEEIDEEESKEEEEEDLEDNREAMMRANEAKKAREREAEIM
jgi:hypothetical protein